MSLAWRPRGTALLVLGLAAGAAGAAGCAEEEDPVAEEPVIRALSHIDTHAAEAAAGVDHAFHARVTLVDGDGAAHVRFDRTWRGLPVIGGDVVVHSAADGAFRGVSRGAAAAWPTTERPTLDAAAAADIAVAAAAAAGVTTRGADTTLAVYARAPVATLAWLARADGERADGTPSELHVVVDAATGAVLDLWDGVETAAGTGRSYYDGTVALATTPITGGYSLRDPGRGNLRTYDLKNRRNAASATLFTDADNTWGDFTLGNRATIGVDAQYGTAVAWDYFLAVHGRSGVGGDGVGTVSRVHYGRKYNNAFWSDSCACATYGDGDGLWFGPFPSLDVVGHELAHGVTSRTADLIYSGESGGLNEATSDIFGAMVEFHAANTSDPGDFLIGERITTSGEPLRYMDDPTKDGSSAGCWSAGVGALNVHSSSGVGNHFFFLLANGSGASAYGNSPTCDGSTVSGIGRAAAQRIWYRALTVYFTSTTNYHGARSATISAAHDLAAALGADYATQVAAAWAAVNVTVAP